MKHANLVVVALLLGLLCLVVPRSAWAYPWMIRHGFTTCNPCHTDPSGGGLLTKYGRDQGDLLLRTRYGAPPDEVSKTSGFLGGVVDPPSWLTLGGSGRVAELRVAPGSHPASTQFLHMQSDLRAQITTQSGFVANASVGYILAGAQPAWITRFSENNLVSREHWVGYKWGDDTAFLVRAGRLNLPFGIRDVVHTLWVRSATRTDINDSQQHGAAFAFTATKTRGEGMAIAGNYQLRPDGYRERGYSAYVEREIVPEATVGLSSLTTHAQRDPRLRLEGTRMAHGLFSRVTPFDRLVLLAEADALFFLPSSGDTRKGYAGLLQADLEIVQGVHAFLTGEAMNPGGPTGGTSYGGWLSALWFFAPHFDLRLDAIEQSVAVGPQRLGVLSLLAQLHVYL